MSIEKCIVKKTLYGNTDNVYKPIHEYHFPSLEKAMSFIEEFKMYTFSYMHKIDLLHTIEGL